MAYPAEKLMALNSTTTPALTTHVINVGLTVSSNPPVFLDFLTVRRSLELEALRLPLSVVDGAPTLLLDEDVDGRRAEERVRRAVSSPMATDSGTMRNVFGSTLLDVPTSFVEFSRFGRPLAAAAQDSRVDKLARKAASWSA